MLAQANRFLSMVMKEKNVGLGLKMEKLQIGNYKEESKSPLRISLVNDLSCSAGYLDGPADIHSVRNISNNFATSLHVYAKPYDACDIYDIGKGQIERKKLGYYSINGKIC